jgi:nucleoside-diphosphate-sugar epimerase
MRILVIGGNRFVGKLVTSLLYSNGYDVTVINRTGTSPVACKVLTADRNNHNEFKKALTDLEFDCVIDMCMYTREHAFNAMQLFNNRIRKYIFVSTIAVYDHCNHFPITESYPANGINNEFGTYATNKAAAEQYMISAKNGFPFIILRPTFILGNDNHLYREQYFFDAIEQNLPVEISGDGTAVLSFVFSPDVAEIIYKLTIAHTHTRAVYNIANDEYVSTNGLIDIIGDISKRVPVIKTNCMRDTFANTTLIISNASIHNALTNFKFRTLKQGLTEIYEHHCKVSKS